MPQGPQGHSPPSSMNPVNAAGQYQHRLSASSAADGSGTSKRSSLPPGFRMPGTQQHNPSPLQRTLTPPGADYLTSGTEPFPSVENLESGGSGSNFHISGSGLPSNSASSNDQTSPLVRHHHSTGSSFGSRSDMLESQSHLICS